MLLLLHGAHNVAGEHRGRYMDHGFPPQKQFGMQEDGFAILFHFDNPICRDSSAASTKTKSSPPKYMVEAIEQVLRFEDFAYSNRNHNHKTRARAGAEVDAPEVTLILITNAISCGIRSLKPSTWPSEQDLNRRVLILDSEQLDRTADMLSFKSAIMKTTSYLVDTSATKNAHSSDTATLYISSMQRFFYIAALLKQNTQQPAVQQTDEHSIDGRIESGAGAAAGAEAEAGAGAAAGAEKSTNRLWESVDGRPIPPVRQCLLIESDNLLYTDTAQLLPYLQQFYSNLAGVVQSNMHFTASIFWVAKYAAIKHLIDFILEIYSSTSEFLAFTTYISKFVGKRVKHGHAPLNAEGNGIPPYSVNEMTLLHYYHHLYKDHQDPLKRPLLQSLPLFVTKAGIIDQKKHGNWKAYVGIPVSRVLEFPYKGTNIDNKGEKIKPCVRHLALDLIRPQKCS